MTLRRNRARPRYSSATVEAPTLFQFVVLSMLLHVLLIVLFGNPTGGARRGEGSLSPLDVTLRSLSPESGSGFRLAPGTETASSGAALLRRLTGTASAPAEAPSREAQPPAPVEALPRLAPAAPEEVDRSLAPAAVSPAKIERVAPPDRQRELAPPVVLPPGAVPEIPVAPIEKTAPPRIERQLAPPVELPPREVPVAPSAPIERIAPAKVEREIAPPVELPPPPVPMAPAAPIERVAPVRIEREIAPPVEVPAARTAPAETVTRPAAETAPATPPSPRNVPGETAPRMERAAPPTMAPPRPQASPTEPSPPLRYGTPDADQDIFKPRRDVDAPPGQTPRIDLDAARKKAAREIVHEGSGSRGIFTIPAPPPTERKSKEAMAMEKAIKPDCRTAYADMGLLAAPALVASAISADGSCRW